MPWIVLYYAAMLAGPPPDPVSTFLPLEARWPVIESAELVYASTYFFVGLAVLAPATRAQARRLIVRGSLASALVFSRA